MVSDTEITINTDLLRTLIRRNKVQWLFAGLVVFSLILFVQLCLIPQTYEALTSISIQQSSGSSSTLALLFSSQSSTKKYIGLLQSRQLAEVVENKYHLQQFYHLSTHTKAIELLQNSIHPDDNAAIGLLNIRFSLEGPPRFWPNGQSRRIQVRHLVADILNTYDAALKHYYATNDNDRDSELLRAADHELKTARQEMDNRSKILLKFIHDLRRHDVMDSPSSGDIDSGATGGSDIAGGGDGVGVLGSLYSKAVETEADIRGAEAAEQEATNGINHLLGNLSSLPDDDPFLHSARLRVKTAQRNYDYLVNAEQLAPENPQVISAQERLRDANAELARQKQAANKDLTSDRLEADVKLQRLKASYAALRRNILSVERSVPTKRELAVELELIKGEEMIAVEKYKEAEVKSVELRLSAVSGQSYINVVDPAIPAEVGQPSISKSALISLLLTALLLAVGLTWQYIRHTRPPSSPPMLREFVDTLSEETSELALNSHSAHSPDAEESQLVKSHRGPLSPK